MQGFRAGPGGIIGNEKLDASDNVGRMQSLNLLIMGSKSAGVIRLFIIWAEHPCESHSNTRPK